MRPFCQACENNKVPILKVLQRVLADSKGVLEIGSGTGQHAVYFAARLPHLQWYPSDLPERLAAIRSWSEAHPAENLREPIPLDAEASDWVVPRHCDAAYFLAREKAYNRRYLEQAQALLPFRQDGG